MPYAIPLRGDKTKEEALEELEQFDLPGGVVSDSASPVQEILNKSWTSKDIS